MLFNVVNAAVVAALVLTISAHAAPSSLVNRDAIVTDKNANAFGSLNVGGDGTGLNRRVDPGIITDGTCANDLNNANLLEQLNNIFINFNDGTPTKLGINTVLHAASTALKDIITGARANDGTLLNSDTFRNLLDRLGTINNDGTFAKLDTRTIVDALFTFIKLIVDNGTSANDGTNTGSASSTNNGTPANDNTNTNSASSADNGTPANDNTSTDSTRTDGTGSPVGFSDTLDISEAFNEN
ncbi:hypothetical protein DFS33DRAFT_1388840 [Desarmillaria ectypa]|nr:hypothetical protein DFS33DRAFT_1388838 [Desarmillaria ectypa]KAK0199257.1 hypothetical protein DFS33DRAFT_1388840 [Desarmillaria ectypa]